MYHMYEKIYRKLKLRRIFKMDSITTFLKKGYDFFQRRVQYTFGYYLGLDYFIKSNFLALRKL